MATEQQQATKTGRPIIFDMGGSNQCIWARAGIVRPTMCINAFDCMSCPLDKKIKQDIADARLTDVSGYPSTGWRDPKTRTNLPAGQKQCRHMMSGMVSFKLCPYNYDCATCPYDQMIEETEAANPASRTECRYVAGVSVPQNHYFHLGHAWARVEYGGRIRVGLDDFGLRLLGQVDGVTLPALGANVHQGEVGLSWSRQDQAAEVLSPVDGIVVARNPGVLRHPAMAREAPYDDGWLMVIQPTKLKTNLKRLLFGEASFDWMEIEVGRLTGMVIQETGQQLAATGGRLVEDVYGQVPELGWDRLVRAFLLT